MKTIMTRREMLQSAGLGLAAVSAGGLAAAKSRKRPNIVILESDSMDGRIMGCAGHPAAYTPNMERLAADGVLFLNTYCNSPQCCPSRSSMWSGRFTHEIEGWNNHKGIERGTPTFQTHLEDAGYQSSVTGKTDYLSGGHSLGARVWAWNRAANIRLPQKDRPRADLERDGGERCHVKDWGLIDQSVRWMKDHANEAEPFMLYCGVSIPHPAFITSPYWLDKIAPDLVQLPPYEEKLHPVMEYMSATKNTLGAFTDKEIRDVRRTYFAMVAECDAMVGALRDALETTGLADSTYFIYLSDHGEANMEHRQYLKNCLYEASARVPLLIAGPGVKSGTVVEDLVSLVDLFPTLMDVAGVKEEAGLSGHSLMPYMQGGKDEDRPDWVLSEYHSNFANTGIFMIRQGPWKYIAYPGYESQLFNLDDDPEEMRNLVASLPGKAKEMDGRLREAIDYEAVDSAAKGYDKLSYRAWRQNLSEEQFKQAMDKIYKAPWKREHDEMIAEWLAAG